MRVGLTLVLVGGLLAACSPSPSSKSGSGTGRYAGIGVFDTGRLWAQMVRENAPSEPEKARIDDDEHVIVVVDTHTGEVRQCGDLSGYCISMNPWNGAKPPAPVKLAKHAVDLDAEAQAKAGAK
ncbi:MAG: hypothetical protein QM608_16835 [Caulobacter sp.]